MNFDFIHLQNINPDQLGPYETTGTPLTNHKRPTLVPLRLLAEGCNPDTVR